MKSIDQKLRVVCFGMVSLSVFLIFSGSILLLGLIEPGKVMAARIFLVSHDYNLFNRNETLAQITSNLSSDEFLDFLNEKWPFYSGTGFGTVILDPILGKNHSIFLAKAGVDLTGTWLDRDRTTMEVRLHFSGGKGGNEEDIKTSFSPNLDRCFLFRLRIDQSLILIVALYPIPRLQGEYKEFHNKNWSVPSWISTVVERHGIDTRRTKYYNKSPEFMAFCESSSVGDNRMTILDPIMLINEGSSYLLIEASSILIDEGKLFANDGKIDRFSFDENRRDSLGSWKGERIEIDIRSPGPSIPRTVKRDARIPVTRNI